MRVAGEVVTVLWDTVRNADVRLPPTWDFFMAMKRGTRAWRLTAPMRRGPHGRESCVVETLSCGDWSPRSGETILLDCRMGSSFEIFRKQCRESAL